MKRIIVGIVSHGHYDYIVNNLALKSIVEIPEVTVVIKDNIKDSKLKSYAEESGFEYVTTPKILGFGDNNNYIFHFAKKNLLANDNDWFIILNPDVEITLYEFKKLITELNTTTDTFLAPNLYKDNDYIEPENSIRYFATCFDLLNPLRLKPINRPYKKELLENKAIVDWASGAFLCITFKMFGTVDGFDSKYFMYYEDVDLCYRLKKVGTYLKFLKRVKAVHKGEYKNRSVFSKHFRWYLSSLFKFLSSKK
ncbi:glycosyltransferase family 2 protein [Pseudoalteromonas sp. MB41]|uniref:glycosyltransferase family 2 protein n=1 Tax=Pseudoalteromonas sp. MB41 TaxID=2896366 RepID=UPI001E627236|nr:glycosyltransferase family 2 protein [Pseudoalteromonas sp. MB41]MCC9661804.1 glycosyltransferase family 2 protein [Pseudoalteromonas sp. MB41]